MNLTCNKCGSTKHEDEFYNCKSSKTGKQPNCKACQKEYRKKWYTEINPGYFWGKDGYFVRRYAETIEYNKDYVRADKDCKIYKLTFEDGDMYIGYTKANIKVRMSWWRKHYQEFLSNPSHPRWSTYGLFKAFIQKGLTSEKIQEVFKSVEVIKHFPGTRYAGLKAEKETINEYIQKGFVLVNTHHNRIS